MKIKVALTRHGLQLDFPAFIRLDEHKVLFSGAFLAIFLCFQDNGNLGLGFIGIW